MSARIYSFPHKQRGRADEFILWYLAALGLMFLCLGLFKAIQWILFS